MLSNTLKRFRRKIEPVDVFGGVISKVNASLEKTGGGLYKSAYQEILEFLIEDIENYQVVIFGRDWILGRVITAEKHINPVISNMIGVHNRHEKKHLFIFAREMSNIMQKQGFKNQIVDHIVTSVIDQTIKSITGKYKITIIGHDYRVEK